MRSIRVIKPGELVIQEEEIPPITREDDLLKLSVVNPRTMYIPNTGSMESWMFTAGGLLVIVVGVVYLVLSRRKGRS